jgi:predicted transcriptional regulator
MSKKIKKVANRLTDKQIDKIWTLFNKGMSKLAISKKVGCSDTTVAYHLAK